MKGGKKGKRDTLSAPVRLILYTPKGKLVGPPINNGEREGTGTDRERGGGEGREETETAPSVAA